jgi:hypothetical protein
MIEVAYRVMGVRLDREWEPWLRADLEDEHWLRRHAAFTVPAFVVFGCLAYGIAAAGGVQLNPGSFGGLIGACLGQLLFAERTRERIKKVQLGPGGSILGDSFTFGHRLLANIAVYLLIFGLLAWFLVLLGD